jgi:hypothetical protein
MAGVAVPTMIVLMARMIVAMMMAVIAAHGRCYIIGLMRRRPGSALEKKRYFIT